MADTKVSDVLTPERGMALIVTGVEAMTTQTQQEPTLKTKANILDAVAIRWSRYFDECELDALVAGTAALRAPSAVSELVEEAAQAIPQEKT